MSCGLQRGFVRVPNAARVLTAPKASIRKRGKKQSFIRLIIKKGLMRMSEQSPYYGMLQEFVNVLYETQEFLNRLDIVLQAETFGLNDDLLEIISLLPPGLYSRVRLCGQINSSLSSHGWGYVYGTVA